MDELYIQLYLSSVDFWIIKEVLKSYGCHVISNKRLNKNIKFSLNEEFDQDYVYENIIAMISFFNEEEKRHEIKIFDNAEDYLSWAIHFILHKNFETLEKGKLEK